MSLRVQQLNASVETITSDKAFLTLVVSVLYRVDQYNTTIRTVAPVWSPSMEHITEPLLRDEASDAEADTSSGDAEVSC